MATDRPPLVSVDVKTGQHEPMMNRDERRAVTIAATAALWLAIATIVFVVLAPRFG